MRSSRVPIYMTCSSWLLLCLAEFPAPGRCWIEHDFMDNGVWWYLMMSLEMWFLLLTSILCGECVWLSFSPVRAPTVTYGGSVSFPVTVAKYPDKSNLKKKELIWLSVPVYSPSSWGSRGAGAWGGYWCYSQPTAESNKWRHPCDQLTVSIFVQFCISVRD